jgi:hypothetical protein
MDQIREQFPRKTYLGVSETIAVKVTTSEGNTQIPLN